MKDIYLNARLGSNDLNGNNRHTLLKRTKSPYISTIVTRGLTLGSGFLNSIILARFLGPEGRGLLAAATLWPLLLVSLGAFGLYESSLIKVSQDRRTANNVITSAIVFSLFLGMIVMVVGYMILPIALKNIGDEAIQTGRLFLLIIPFGMLHAHLAAIFRGLTRINLHNIIQLIIPLGLLLVSIILIFLELINIYTILILHLILMLITVLVWFILLITLREFTAIKLDVGLMRSMINYGLRVYIGTVFSLANLRLDQILMVSIVTAEQLGYYIVAVRVAEITGVVATALVTVAVPRIARVKEPSRQIHEATRHFQVYWYVNLIIKLLYIPAVILLIPTVYGTQFVDAVPVAIVLVIGSVFMDGKRVLTGLAQALNAPWLGSRAEIIAAASTFALLLLLLPPFGIIGAALTSLCAYLIAMGDISNSFRRRFGVSFQHLFSTRALVRELNKLRY